jgi:hypothetical protein
MTVVVVPQTFVFVNFDADEIASVANSVLAQLGMTTDLHIEVDETTPVARIRADLGDPIRVSAESGAFEDVRRPRYLSTRATELSLGRVLLRARDRADGSFAPAPPDGEVPLPEMAAWDTYVVGRLQRAGQVINRQRFLYNFRNRHGFTDAVDAAFERLWRADTLTWSDLVAISATARGR